jgi:hypothetical protein
VNQGLLVLVRVPGSSVPNNTTLLLVENRKYSMYRTEYHPLATLSSLVDNILR